MESELVFKGHLLKVVSAKLTMAGALLMLYLAFLLLWQAVIWYQLGEWIPLPGALLFADHELLRSFASGNPVAEKTHAILACIPQFDPEKWLGESKEPKAVRGFIMSLLRQVHVGVLPALPGFLMWISGMIISRKQAEAIEASTSA